MSRIDPSAEQLLIEMQDNRLYGEVVVKYEGGKVVLLKKQETIKPAARNNREDGEDNG
jgi:hypothetical protein